MTTSTKSEFTTAVFVVLLFAAIVLAFAPGCGDNLPAMPVQDDAGQTSPDAGADADTVGNSAPAPLAPAEGCWRYAGPAADAPSVTEIDLFLGGALRAYTNGAEVDGTWRMDYQARQLDLTVEFSAGMPPVVQTTTQIYDVQRLTTLEMIVTNRQTDTVYGRSVCR